MQCISDWVNYNILIFFKAMGILGANKVFFIVIITLLFLKFRVFNINFFVVWIENFNLISLEHDIIEIFFCNWSLLYLLIFNKNRTFIFKENHSFDISKCTKDIIEHFHGYNFLLKPSCIYNLRFSSGF